MSELLKKMLEVAKTNKGTLSELVVGVPVIGVLADQIAVVDSLPVKCILSEVILGIFAIYCVYKRVSKVTKKTSLKATDPMVDGTVKP